MLREALGTRPQAIHGNRSGDRSQSLLEPSLGGSVVVGMPGFEPHQPIQSSPGVYVPVSLTCMITTDVCYDVHVYAHRL
jgi:hypothetical protein